MADKAENMSRKLETEEEEPDVIWSIGIYSGDTLVDLNPAARAANPVVSAENIFDVRAKFVADPFMICDKEGWYMFFEVMNTATLKGEIGLATSRDGFVWDYRRIVLREPFHLSYPYVFHLDGEYYMIPETYEANSIRLYRANPFPTDWVLEKSILPGAWLDNSVVFHRGLWWMFTCPYYSNDDVLELFYADKIDGPWHRHPISPVVTANNQIARPAGRVIVVGDKLIRFTQACYPDYGMWIRAFRVTELTTSVYGEEEVRRSPLLSGGQERWNRSGMHHIDPHWKDGGWLACVDGWRTEMLRRTEPEL